MKHKLLLFFIIFTIMFLPLSKVFAINMNLATENNFYENSSNNAINTENTSRGPVTITTTNENEFLTIENILSIILIVIGILLILLGIAIIIRFK